MTEKWCLLLSGGAALGATQVYTIERLIEEKGYPAVVCGTSVGACNAVKVGQKHVEGLRELWDDVRSTGWFQAPNFDVWEGLFTLNPLKRKVRRELERRSVRLPTYVGVTDLEMLRHELHCLNRLGHNEQVQAVVNSSTQPAIHETTSKFADGGILHVMPTLPGPASDFDEIHAIFAGPIGLDRIEFSGYRPGAVWAGGRAMAAWLNVIIREDVERLKAYSLLSRVYLYAPKDPGGIFDARESTIQWRLNEVGKEVYASRTKL